MKMMINLCALKFNFCAEIDMFTFCLEELEFGDIRFEEKSVSGHVI